MTLIEVLLEYRELLRVNGRAAANSWLNDVCREEIQSDIIATFNDGGHFIDADKEIIFGIVR